MSETTPRREATRQRLVEAAITEFAARSIDGTSVEQLCEAAGFTRGAFYSNFATKDDLCVAVLEYHRDLVLDGLQRTFAEPPADAGVEWVTGVGLQQLADLIAPSDDFRTTLAEIQLRGRRNPELAERNAELHRQVRPGLAQLIDGLADRFDIRFRLSTEQVLDVFEALFFYQLSGGHTPGIQELIGPVATALAEPIEENRG